MEADIIRNIAWLTIQLKLRVSNHRIPGAPPQRNERLGSDLLSRFVTVRARDAVALQKVIARAPSTLYMTFVRPTSMHGGWSSRTELGPILEE